MVISRRVFDNLETFETFHVSPPVYIFAQMSKSSRFSQFYTPDGRTERSKAQNTNREIECIMSHNDDSVGFGKIQMYSSKKVSGLNFLKFFGFREFSGNNLAIFLPKRFSNNRLETPQFQFRAF